MVYVVEMGNSKIDEVGFGDVCVVNGATIYDL